MVSSWREWVLSMEHVCRDDTNSHELLTLVITPQPAFCSVYKNSCSRFPESRCDYSLKYTYLFNKDRFKFSRSWKRRRSRLSRRFSTWTRCSNALLLLLPARKSWALCACGHRANGQLPLHAECQYRGTNRRTRTSGCNWVMVVVVVIRERGVSAACTCDAIN
jgi:hypothetical protein